MTSNTAISKMLARQK